MPSIIYSESKSFYTTLDAAIRNGETIVVRFEAERLSANAKLWRRLRRCANWDDLESELTATKDGRLMSSTSTGPKIGILATPAFQIGLATETAWLFAWIATLVAGLIAFAIYKNYKVVVEVDQGHGHGKLVFKKE